MKNKTKKKTRIEENYRMANMVDCKQNVQMFYMRKRKNSYLRPVQQGCCHLAGLIAVIIDGLRKGQYSLKTSI